MLVKEIMSAAVVTVNPDQTLRDAFVLLQSNHVRQLPVVQGGILVGIITDRDVKRAMPSVLSGIDRDEYDKVLDNTTFGQLMTREPITVAPDAKLKDVVKIFMTKKVGALPILQNGKLAGIVTQTDVLRVFYESLPE